MTASANQFQMLLVIGSAICVADIVQPPMLRFTWAALQPHLKFLSMSSTPADVLIIGAGPSGLAVATGLARQAYTTIVFDAGDYRNARAEYMHNVPGFDHTPPEFFRNEVKNDISRRYDTVTFENVNVVEIRKARLRLPNAERGPVHGQERRHAGQNKRNEEDAEESQDSFEVLDSKGRVWEGRKVVLASGVTDEMLPIEGYAQCWAKGM